MVWSFLKVMKMGHGMLFIFTTILVPNYGNGHCENATWAHYQMTSKDLLAIKHKIAKLWIRKHARRHAIVYVKYRHTDSRCTPARMIDIVYWHQTQNIQLCLTRFIHKHRHSATYAYNMQMYIHICITYANACTKYA